MKKNENKTGEMFFRFANILALAITLTACGSPAVATGVITEIAITENPAVGAADTESILSVPATVEAQFILPAAFQSGYLNPLDTPRTYLQDTCKYLRAKWNPYNAEPGTVVMIIMLHGVYGSAPENPEDIDSSELRKIMKQLKTQGFEAINIKQLLSFMERNVYIPPRSVLFVRDGRYEKEDFDKNFRQYWDDWKWPIINGWASQADTPEKLWLENIQMENEGFVDHQAQGVQVGSYLSDDSSKVIIARELQGSLDAFERFGKTPIAFVWQGGGFGQRPVEIARELGYQLGFTANSRGPVMYNWVPLADEVDKKRPSYIPEGAIKDPLMTLPRYWPHQALSFIDTVRVIGKDAKAYAEANKDAELEYYKNMCEPAYEPIPILPK